MLQSHNPPEVYQSLYGLPEYSYEERVSLDFFRLCRPDYNFVVIGVCNQNGDILLIRDLNKNIGYELVGGYIEKGEGAENAAHRVVSREVGLKIDELRPIAIVKNVFRRKKRVVTHYGIAFAALSGGRIKLQPPNIQSIFVRKLMGVMPYQNRRIFKDILESVHDKPFGPPYCEIESGRRFLVAHTFNKYFVRIIGGFASRKIRKKVLSLIISRPRSICDVCCGDDDFIYSLEKLFSPRLCVANDISWEALSLLRKRGGKSRIFFTNHNVLDLPFHEKFGLTLFKNSLHHISRSEQLRLLKRLLDISEQLIVVDVENPAKTSLLSKMWHSYYVHFLGDCGGAFSSLQDFKEKVEQKNKDMKISYGHINTVKGKYFYASFVGRGY